MKVLSNSPEETIGAGRRIGEKLVPGDTVCIYGDLGAGKTTLVKGIGEALGIPARDITSASFTIIAEYETDPPFYHIDLYRIQSEAELEDLGLYEYLGTDGIAVVEWAEKIKNPGECISVKINFISQGSREIIIEAT